MEQFTVLDVVEGTPELIDRERSSVGFEETPVGRGEDLVHFHFFADELLVHTVQEVVAVGVERIVVLAVNEGQNAVETAKHAIGEEVVVGDGSDRHIRLFHVLELFQFGSGYIFAHVVVLFGDMRGVRFFHHRIDVGDWTSNRTRGKGVSTPKTVQVGAGGQLIFAEELDHGGDTFHFFFLFIEEGDTVFLDCDDIFNAGGFVWIVLGLAFLQVADNEQTVRCFDSVRVEVFERERTFLCF